MVSLKLPSERRQLLRSKSVERLLPLLEAAMASQDKLVTTEKDGRLRLKWVQAGEGQPCVTVKLKGQCTVRMTDSDDPSAFAFLIEQYKVQYLVHAGQGQIWVPVRPPLPPLPPGFEPKR